MALDYTAPRRQAPTSTVSLAHIATTTARCGLSYGAFLPFVNVAIILPGVMCTMFGSHD